MAKFTKETASKNGKKGGKASAKAQKEAKIERENMSLTSVMEELLKTKDYKQKVCKDFLDGKFSAKSMEVLLKMLNVGKEDKPTTLEDFLNEEI